MAHVRADVESAAGPLFGGEPASLCGVPPVGDLGQRVAGICVCHFQPPPAVSRSRRQGQRTMPGDVASTKKGAEHAKSPRNDDRGFSVAARARGLDSSAPAQRGWGLRAAGPIIHPCTARARTRTRQVGITGHRNGSIGWRKIQQGVAQNSTRGISPTPSMWPISYSKTAEHPFSATGRLATWAACANVPTPSA